MPRYLSEGVASAAINADSRRRAAASLCALVLFKGANAEPFQYNDVITAPGKAQAPVPWLGSSCAPRQRGERYVAVTTSQFYIRSQALVQCCQEINIPAGDGVAARPAHESLGVLLLDAIANAWQAITESNMV